MIWNFIVKIIRIRKVFIFWSKFYEIIPEMFTWYLIFWQESLRDYRQKMALYGYF